jgi:predicted RNA-binding protein with PIN domain
MTAHRIVVVFDSGQGTTEAPILDPGGIEVRFATEAANADDDIVDLVTALASHAVVITNDRDLRERVEAQGALALWASALVEWVRAA